MESPDVLRDLKIELDWCYLDLKRLNAQSACCREYIDFQVQVRATSPEHKVLDVPTKDQMDSILEEMKAVMDRIAKINAAINEKKFEKSYKNQTEGLVPVEGDQDTMVVEEEVEE
jgi:hypothetical protein